MSALEQSMQGFASAHNIRAISITLHHRPETTASPFYLASLHWDSKCAQGIGDSLGQAIQNALQDMATKRSHIIDGELSMGEAA